MKTCLIVAFALTLACILAPASSQAQNAYITNYADGTVSVIDTTTDTVTATIPVGSNPFGVAITADGSTVYVANYATYGTVSVIDTAVNAVTATIPVADGSWGLAVTPDGSKVYVAHARLDGAVSVIDTATDTVIGLPIPVGRQPFVFGAFIQPAPRFAGIPGSTNCLGTSVSALANKFGDLDAAATALRFSNVQGLRAAIQVFCGA